MLKKRGNLDIEVFAGEAEKIPVRLVAIPVDDSIAEKRRRNLRNNRDKRMNPSKKHLFLLGWNLFISNVEKEKLSDKEIALLANQHSGGLLSPRNPAHILISFQRGISKPPKTSKLFNNL